MTRYTNPLIRTVLLCAAVPGCAAAPPAANPGPTVPAAPRTVEATFTDAAGSRSYRLHVSSAHDGRRELPLLVMLHGCTQNAADIAAGTRMDDVAEEHGLIVVFPEQPASANPQRCWNWYLPEHRGRGAGEAALIAGITREVMQNFRVDPARVYVAGVSAGGAMAMAMAAGYPDVYAAAASHSGIMLGAASSVAEALAAMQGRGPMGEAVAGAIVEAMGTRARAVPLMVIHGAADPVVAAVNARSIVEQWLHAHRAFGVAIADGAADEATETVGGQRANRARFRDATGRVLVESLTIEGLGHAWSGGSADGTFTDPGGPDASREIVRFFLQHPRT